MTKSRPPLMAVAVLTAGLVIGGTSGAIAAGQIGTNGIRNGAVTTPKLHNNAVTSGKIRNGGVKKADLAHGALGAKVIQYVASGTSIDTNSVLVQIPGTWTPAMIGGSTWSVQLVRTSSPPTDLFSLGQSAPAGENTSDGFYLEVNSGVLTVHISATSYSAIDTIRITRTIPTSRVQATVTKRAPRVSAPVTR